MHLEIGSVLSQYSRRGEWVHDAAKGATKATHLGESDERISHRERQLHGQLGGHYRGDDHDAVEHELVPGIVVGRGGWGRVTAG
jgi:hypothetical protein